MKKFLTIALLWCLVGVPVWAATYNCQVQEISPLSFKSSNEFLFVTVADWNHSNGKALVCGHRTTNGCDNGTMVFVTGHHYHTNKLRTDTWFYECSSTGANSWDAVGVTSLPECNSLDGMEFITRISEKYVYVPSDVKRKYASSSYYISDKFCWSDKQKSVAPDPVVVQPKCPDGSSEKILSQNGCKSNETFNCEKFTDGKCVCGRCLPKEVQEGDPLKKCLDSRTTREGKACCYLPKSVATWNGKNCICQPEDKMEFKIGANGSGFCQAKELKAGEKFQCDANILAQLEAWENECKDQEQIVEWIKRLKELCKSDEVTVQKFNEYYSMLLALGLGNCTWDNKIEVDVDVKLPGGNGGDRNAELSNSRRKISDAHTVLRGMADTFKVSVWKDEEGKFNTARLASDSVAAVVLGTTGALVTSNIVKKNQVENGFEDIKCTIGGQTVADWGDEFRVGIQ